MLVCSVHPSSIHAHLLLASVFPLLFATWMFLLLLLCKKKGGKKEKRIITQVIVILVQIAHILYGKQNPKGASYYCA